MVVRRSRGGSTQRTLPAERHEVCSLETPSRIISDPFIVEYGHADVNIVKVNSHADRLLAGLGDAIPAFMSHFDKLVNLPTVSEIDLRFWANY